MGKSKKRGPTLEEILERPWCYYCERDFDDMTVLLNHQKARHYKCNNCHRRLNTIGGLKVHMNQVHKEEITEVENALPNRKEIVPGLEIFAMEGIPEDVLMAHRTRITELYFKMEAEFRLKTGNPPPGQAAGGANGENASKKRKLETPEEIKARLAEHRKKRAAEKAAKEAGLPVKSEDENNSIEGTPANGSGFNAPANLMPPTPATVPGTAQPFGFTGSPSNSGFSPFTAPPPQTAFSPVGQAPFAQPPTAFPPPGMPPHSMPPMQPQGFGAPPFGQAPQAWSPTGMAGPPQHAANNDTPSFGFRPPVSSTSQRQGSGPPPNAPGMLPGLPSPAPGLPQRPSFQAPNLSREEMAHMHTGHYSENLHNRHDLHQLQPQAITQEASTPAVISREDHSAAVPGSGAAQDQAFSASLEELMVEAQQHAQTSARRSLSSATGDSTSHIAAYAPQTKATTTVAASTTPSAPRPVIDKSSIPKSASTDSVASSDNTAVTKTTGMSRTQQTPSNFSMNTASSSTGTSLTAPTTSLNTSSSSNKKKKKHDANTRLVYSDDVVSPEEKMSNKSKYAYQRPRDQTETITGPISAGVTGVTGDTVRDPQDAHAGS